MKTKQSPIVKLSLMGIIFLGVAFGYTQVQLLVNKISELPIEGSVSAKSPAMLPVVDTPETLHPLLVQSKERSAMPKNAMAASALDEVFGLDVARKKRAQALEKLAQEKKAAEEQAREAEKKSKKEAKADVPKDLELPVFVPAPHDGFAPLVDVAVLQAISGGTAILNGEQLKVGQPSAALAYWSSDRSKRVEPILVEIKAEQVLIKEAEGERRITVPLFHQDN